MASSSSTILSACTDAMTEVVKQRLLPEIASWLKENKQIDVTVEELSVAIGAPTKAGFQPPSFSGAVVATPSPTAKKGHSTAKVGSPSCTFVITRGNNKGSPCGKAATKDGPYCSNHAKNKSVQKAAGENGDAAPMGTLSLPNTPIGTRSIPNGIPKPPEMPMIGKLPGLNGVSPGPVPTSSKNPANLDCDQIEIEEDGKDVQVLRDRKHGYIIDSRSGKHVVMAIDPKKDGNPRGLTPDEVTAARNLGLFVLA